MAIKKKEVFLPPLFAKLHIKFKLCEFSFKINISAILKNNHTFAL